MALIRRLVAAISCMGVMGCAPLIDDSPPPGFVEAESDWQSQHDKGKGSVGLRVTIYDNVDGGTLDYGSNDLETKLRGRGYTLENSSTWRLGETSCENLSAGWAQKPREE